MSRSPASAHRGASYRGSIRDILRNVARFSLPDEFRPFNRTWRFRRERDEQTLRRMSAQLRVLADEVDHWLDRDE